MLILTYIDESYLHWAAHLYRNLGFFQLQRALTMCCADDHAIAFAMRRRLPFVKAASVGPHNSAYSFGTQKYKAVLATRHACFYKIFLRTRAGEVTLFVDPDVTFLQDPTLQLTSIFQMAAQDDAGPGRRPGVFLRGVAIPFVFCAGFFALRRSNATLLFYRKFLRELELVGPENDQDVINAVGWRLESERKLSISMLPQTAFLNGYRFYETRLNVDRTLVSVHHNWISTDARKRRRAKGYNLLTVKNDTLGRFLDRFWSQANELPAWSPR
jgi:hypothetical protein